MTPIKIDNLFSEEELYFLYRELISATGWRMTGNSGPLDFTTNKNFNHNPQFPVKEIDQTIINYAWYLYGQSIVYRLQTILAEKKIGLHSHLDRMWFNMTLNGSKAHWLHPDKLDEQSQSILPISATYNWTRITANLIVKK